MPHRGTLMVAAKPISHQQEIEPMLQQRPEMGLRHLN